MNVKSIVTSWIIALLLLGLVSLLSQPQQNAPESNATTTSELTSKNQTFSATSLLLAQS